MDWGSGNNICFINSNKVWGGGEKWYYDFSIGLLREGYNVFAVTDRNTDLFFKLQAANIPILTLEVNHSSFLNPLKIIKLYRFFKKNSIYVAIMGYPMDMKLGGIAAKLAGLERILYRRGSAVPVKNRLFNRFLFKHILTGVIVNSLETKRALLENNSNLIESNKIHLLYNCIDPENYNNTEPVNIFRSKMDGEIWLGNTGRLVEVKGQNLLIDLAIILKKNNIRFKILIAGIGDLEKKLKEQTISLGLEDDIIFLGFVKDICSFMHSIDIFLFTSLREGSANVLLEAMACAKPVVAFNISSMSEIVEHNHTGFLAEFKSIRSFSDWVIHLIENPNLRIQMGMNGKQRIDEKFNTTKIMQEFLSIIK